MVRLFIEKYNVLGRDLDAWKKKKKKEYKNYMEYNKNKLMILNFLLGRLNKKGHKARSFFILTNLLWYLKKNKKKWIMNILKKNKKWSLTDILKWLLFQRRQVVLLYNKKKGSLVYELPRFLTVEQSLKRIINWIIKIAEKNKKNMINSLMEELENIYFKKGEIWKKKKYIRDIAMKNRPFFYLLRKKKKRRKN